MAPNFWMQVYVTMQKLLAGKKIYNPVSISRKQARLLRHLFYDKRHSDLSTGDIIMSMAVSFFCAC